MFDKSQTRFIRDFVDNDDTSFSIASDEHLRSLSSVERVRNPSKLLYLRYDSELINVRQRRRERVRETAVIVFLFVDFSTTNYEQQCARREITFG